MTNLTNSPTPEDKQDKQEINNLQDNQEINDVSELLKRDFREMAQESIDNELVDLKKTAVIEIGDDANWKSTRNDIITCNNAIYEFKVEKNLLIVRFVQNAAIHRLRKLKTLPNNGSKEQTKATMEMQLITQKGTITSPFLLDGSSKTKTIEYAKTLADASNHVIYQGNDNTLRLIRDHINKNYHDTVYLIPNSGEIGVEGIEGRIYANGFADKNGFTQADNDGTTLIQDKKRFKIDGSHGANLPCMYTGEVDTRVETYNLLSSMDKGFKGKIEPFLALGLGVMGMFSKDIWRDTSGFPTAFLYGASKQGKSTIQNIINYIYGFDEKFLALGNSTSRSVNRKKNLYNGCVIHLNDVSAKVLMREEFENNVIESYEQGLREKLKNGSEFNNLQQNSVMFISSNYLPIQKEKMLNRILPINFVQNMYDHTQMLNYYKKPYQLSRIMLDLLKFGWNGILPNIKTFDSWLAEKCEITPSRESSNVAIAYTGLLLLQEIGGYKLENQEQKLLKYFEWYLEQFQQLEDPVDSFINYLPQMLNEGVLQPEEHFWIEKGKDKTIKLTISTSACLHKYNCYIGKVYYDKFVHPKEFAEAVKNSAYFADKKNVRYKLPKHLKCSPVANSYVLDISENQNSEIIFWAYEKQVAARRHAEENGEE